MILVADTNIVFSILLKKDSKEGEIFLRDDTEVFIPKFLMVELFKHKEKIIRLSGLGENEILELLYLILRYCSVFDEEDIPDDIKTQAFSLVRDIDQKDWVFVASAMSLNAKLWSGDKKLITGLKSKGNDIAVQTKDIY
ncbi:MAG: PIN domain-containing protein [Desulfobacterales bacterium]